MLGEAGVINQHIIPILWGVEGSGESEKNSYLIPQNHSEGCNVIINLKTKLESLPQNYSEGCNVVINLKQFELIPQNYSGGCNCGNKFEIIQINSTKLF
jgi:hypothetical protein